MESWLSFCRFTAAVAAVLWVGFVIISYLLRPMLSALSRMLGADFAAVLSPLVLIGVFSALAVVTNTAVNQFMPKSAGFLASFQAIVFSVVTPICAIILEFRDFILNNWMVSVAYLLVVLFVVLKKFFKTNEG
jgi:hypothetical protein